MFFSCDDMISFCDYHSNYTLSSRFMPPASSIPTCCETFFDWANPVFTVAGTCYATNATIMEQSASVFSAFKVMADAREDLTPREWKII